MNVPSKITLEYMLPSNLQIKLLLHFKRSFFFIKKKNYIWVTLLCSSKFSKRHCYVAQNLSVLQFYKLLSDCLVSFSICFFKWLSLVFPLSLAFEIHYEFFNDIVQSSISLSLQSFFPSFFCFKTYFWIFVLFFLSNSKW